MDAYVDPPDQWARTSSRGPGPFVTHERLVHPDGTELHWESREHRKCEASAGGVEARVGIWFRPDRRNWWMAALFVVGSLCFTVGGIASQWNLASTTLIGAVFVVGSIFFTSAAYLQYSEAVNAARGVCEPKTFRRWRPASWEPKRIDWLACVVQLVGTVLFNISTIAALENKLTPGQEDVRIWAPNAFGSIAFLVASELAYAEVCHKWFALSPRTLPWRIVVINLLGSIAFGASAVASLVQPGSGHPINADIANAGTWLGAICFLVGALMLIPEAAGHTAVQAAKRAVVAAAASSEGP